MALWHATHGTFRLTGWGWLAIVWAGIWLRTTVTFRSK